MSAPLALSVEQLHLLAELADATGLPTLVPVPFNVEDPATLRLVRGVAARSLGARGLVVADADELHLEPRVEAALRTLAAPDVMVVGYLEGDGDHVAAVWAQAGEEQATLAHDREGYVLEPEAGLRDGGLHRALDEVAAADGAAPGAARTGLEVRVGRVGADGGAAREALTWVRRESGELVQVDGDEIGAGTVVSVAAAHRALDGLLAGVA